MALPRQLEQPTICIRKEGAFWVAWIKGNPTRLARHEEFWSKAVDRVAVENGLHGQHIKILEVTGTGRRY